MVIAPHPLYSTLPGTAWISDATSGRHRQGATTLFRRAPIRRVALKDEAGPYVRELAGLQHLRRLVGLSLRGCGLDFGRCDARDWLDAVALPNQSPWAGRLEVN